MCLISSVVYITSFFCKTAPVLDPRIRSNRSFLGWITSFLVIPFCQYAWYKQKASKELITRVCSTASAWFRTRRRFQRIMLAYGGILIWLVAIEFSFSAGRTCFFLVVLGFEPPFFSKMHSFGHFLDLNIIPQYPESGRQTSRQQTRKTIIEALETKKSLRRHKTTKT